MTIFTKIGSRAHRLLAKNANKGLMTNFNVANSYSGISAPIVSSTSQIALNVAPPSISAPVYASRRFLSTSADKAETLSFQAETRKLLDIVTHSIYTDKEVFLRELISNASDALEKYRYYQATGNLKNASDEGSNALEINLYTDPVNNTITLIDSGIGMTRDDLVSHLGTIARSGSKQFVEQFSKGDSPASQADGIIGQFGVGFYSSFMVSDSVTVESISALDEAQSPHKWSSDGSGEFSISPVESIESMTNKHGCKITMKLKESCKEFSDPERVKSIIKHYSSFVSFPIKVDGEVVNTIKAIWTQDKREVTDEQYDEFYRFISNAYDVPKYRLHFRTDAPIELKCLLFVPAFHGEKFGASVQAPGINLYSRKVLIESKPKDLLPEWLRFLKGVVDSEDLPLSLSREKPQDSNLIRRIREVLTRKFLKYLEDELKENPAKYKEFYLEYHVYLKQGLCQEYRQMDQIAKLLLFETTASPAGDFTTLDEYISRCSPEQKEIYYLVAPSREAALNSPYYETFKKHNREVLLLYNAIDDFVMTNLNQYSGRTLISADKSDINFEKTEEETKEGEVKHKLTEEEGKDLCAWLTITLGNRVKEVKVTNRLSDSPVVVTDHQSGSLRRMMKMVDQLNARKDTTDALPPQILEVNPNHPLILELFKHKDNVNTPAAKVAQQLFDNALISAGLIEDPRTMIPRINDLLLASLKKD